MSKCIEKVGNGIDSAIANFFLRLGRWVAHNPRKAIGGSIVLTAILGVGIMTSLETESRGEELFVPQDTQASKETDAYEAYFPPLSRFEQILVQSSGSDGSTNVLTKERLMEAMQMHLSIESGISVTDGEEYDLLTLCSKGGNTCASSSQEGVCQCRLTSILRQWNYNMDELESDQDILATISEYGTQDDLNAILSEAVYDEDGQILSARAFSISYFLDDRSSVEDGEESDPINEEWEKVVFLDTVEPFEKDYPKLFLNWFSGRSLDDDARSTIQGDLQLVQYSYIAVFLFLGATLGNFKCGLGSRWTMAIAAIMLVGLSTVAGIGLSAFIGLIYSPVHSLLPFVLLGIGVDDAFVIANAFDQERKGNFRTRETNEELLLRSSRALCRAGASITVTSFTDLVAFAISSSSKLPALSSFSAYASISVFFLWALSSVFFTACLVFDERRQIENRRECLCCLTRKNNAEEADGDTGNNNDEPMQKSDSLFMKYFKKVHGKAILSRPGKVITLLVFAFLLAFGVYSSLLLEVEDTQRDFVPPGTSLREYFDASDELFPDQGIEFFFVFETQSNIFDSRQELAQLDERVSGMSQEPPYIAEPVSEEVFTNVMAAMKTYLDTYGTEAIGGATLGDDGWPTSESDFAMSLREYTLQGAPGGRFNRNVAFSDNGSTIEAISVASEYVRLTKENRAGETIDDADKQIDAMDTTRDMVESWTDLQPAFVYSDAYLTIEGFKVIQEEFFRNVFMAVAAVAVIVLLTVASPIAALLITFCVVGCIIEILGFMYHLGIVIDSVSAVMLVLAVGLSVDYSAHIGHSFMTKTGDDRNERVMDTLSDVGTAVLNGAITTFLAVAILLMSESYVFWVLSRMFMLTVVFGVTNGLVLLPVLLSLFGPKAFAHHSKSDEDTSEEAVDVAKPERKSLEHQESLDLKDEHEEAKDEHDEA